MHDHFNYCTHRIRAGVQALKTDYKSVEHIFTILSKISQISCYLDGYIFDEIFVVVAFQTQSIPAVGLLRIVISVKCQTNK